MGNNHSCIINDKGQLFTFGHGANGRLGHNNEDSYTEPKLVDFFEKNNLKVLDAFCGDKYTLALTNDGDGKLINIKCVDFAQW